jgi:hypothetical protein
VVEKGREGLSTIIIIIIIIIIIMIYKKTS